MSRDFRQPGTTRVGKPRPRRRDRNARGSPRALRRQPFWQPLRRREVGPRFGRPGTTYFFRRDDSFFAAFPAASRVPSSSDDSLSSPSFLR